MPKTPSLPPEKLRAVLDPSTLSFGDSSGFVVDEACISPQPRALNAMELALKVKEPEYNVFVAGDAATGRMHFVREFLQPRIAQMPTPPDVIYVYNFEDADRPRCVQVPAGAGRKLKNELAEALSRIRRELPAELEQEGYLNEYEGLYRDFRALRDKVLLNFEHEAEKLGFEVELDEHGGLSIHPLHEGRVISPEDYERLTPGVRKTLKSRSENMRRDVSEVMRRLSREERDFRHKVRELETKTAREILDTHLKPLAEAWEQTKPFGEFLKELREDVLHNLDRFIPQESSSGHLSRPGDDPSAEERFFDRYDVNLFVNNEKAAGAPFIYEDHPTMSNLLGCIEREAEMGTLYTDFTLVKSGSLHRANGGFLVMRIEDLLENPEAWEGLLRMLLSGAARIEDPGDGQDTAKTKTVEPEPLPLDLKIILIGEDLMHEELLYSDERFRKLFSLKAHLQEYVPRTAENIAIFIASCVKIIRSAELPDFDAAALAGLVDYASRLAEDQKRLSLRFPLMKELMIEAAAAAEGMKTVGKGALDKALADRAFRFNLYEEEFMEEYDRELIKVSTEGEAVGRANGLSLSMYGDYEFALPHQIACTVGVGHGDIMDLEREAELGGPIHTKGMMILKSYLLGLFAQDKPLVLTGSLCFEQSYAQVEGDSASAAELAALLSSLSGVPLSLSLAFTGAVSQSGHILAVGGVTCKVEGFFEVCRRRGLTGRQGVIVPWDNIPHLMLKDEVAEAVANKTFHVYPVKSIEEAMEILTGIPTSGKLSRGLFAPGSLYRRVDERLTELASLADARLGREPGRRRRGPARPR
jgi:predicted ATP-dependent protease